MKTLTFFVTGLMLFFGVGLCQECVLPQLDEDVDWSKLEGTFWYETLQIPGHGPYDCKVETDFQLTSAGFMTRFGEERRLDEAPLVEYYSVERAKYKLTVQSERNLVVYAAKVSMESGKSKDDILKSLQLTNVDLAGEVLTFYTDYKSLVIGFVCEGPQKVVFVKTKTPKITAQGVTDVHNILADLEWGDAKLELVIHCTGETNDAIH